MRVTEDPPSCVIYSRIDGRSQLSEDEADGENSNGLVSSTEAQATAAPVGFGQGERHPDFDLTAEDGRVLSLESFRGKVVLLQFTASWCHYCHGELPELVRLHERFKGHPGFVVAAIGSGEPVARTRYWVREQSEDLPLYDCGLSGRYARKITYHNGQKRHASVPSMFLIDRNGVNLLARRGAMSGERWQHLALALEALLQES